MRSRFAALSRLLFYLIEAAFNFRVGLKSEFVSAIVAMVFSLSGVVVCQQHPTAIRS
jgi:low affinity Fe/Cu permease